MHNILAQSYTTGMRAYRLAELVRHKDYCKVLADTSETIQINLSELGCRPVCLVCLEELPKHPAVMRVFASGNADTVRFEFAPDAGMTKDAVDTVLCP